MEYNYFVVKYLPWSNAPLGVFMDLIVSYTSLSVVLAVTSCEEGAWVCEQPSKYTAEMTQTGMSLVGDFPSW